MKYLINTITILLFIITINHYFRNLNYIVFMILLIVWILTSIIINRLNNSKF